MLGLVAGTKIAGILGCNMVLPVGGADMPVVVSLLNSISGLATSAAGSAGRDGSVQFGEDVLRLLRVWHSSSEVGLRTARWRVGSGRGGFWEGLALIW